MARNDSVKKARHSTVEYLKKVRIVDSNLETEDRQWSLSGDYCMDKDG